MGGHGSPRHYHHNAITNVSFNSTKHLGHKGRNDSSAFRIWHQAESRLDDTTVSTGKNHVGAVNRALEEHQVEEGRQEEAIVEEQYEGHEPRQFRRQEAPAGLYVLQVGQVLLFSLH